MMEIIVVTISLLIIFWIAYRPASRFLKNFLEQKQNCIAKVLYETKSRYNTAELIYKKKKHELEDLIQLNKLKLADFKVSIKELNAEKVSDARRNNKRDLELLVKSYDKDKADLLDALIYEQMQKSVDRELNNFFDKDTKKGVCILKHFSIT